ncbi:hypothetical protein GPECTOR_13g773 [Gonium pectorale]|uniref:AB hydrolase-1 domain-containing protein n=1 Tax=Gonium pectorale TaxID=33097 RepID=A0A150GN41_GONPE|nr:hypothetical protein GPECTOR_13g773 [Gonium pectorale]|eukprot:KXZ51286.1 hypothetical protein GPECTOR_13g773 [Gonium pectorale]
MPDGVQITLLWFEPKDAPADGPIVVSLHGIGGDEHSVRPLMLAEECLKRGWTSVLYVRRGHGESSLLPVGAVVPPSAGKADVEMDGASSVSESVVLGSAAHKSPLYAGPPTASEGGSVAGGRAGGRVPSPDPASASMIINEDPDDEDRASTIAAADAAAAAVAAAALGNGIPVAVSLGADAGSAAATPRPSSAAGVAGAGASPSHPTTSAHSRTSLDSLAACLPRNLNLPTVNLPTVNLPSLPALNLPNLPTPVTPTATSVAGGSSVMTDRDSVLRTRKAFPQHADTEDLHAVLRHIRAGRPRAPMLAVGFSMGSNVLVKYLGEYNRTEQQQQPAVAAAAEAHGGQSGGGSSGGAAGGAAASAVEAAEAVDAEDCNPLMAAISVCNGYDIVEGTRELVSRRALADRIITAALHRLLRRKLPEVHAICAAHGLLVDFNEVLACNTLHEFERALMLPICGVADLDAYYERNNCKTALQHVSVPLLCLSARDDPIIGPRLLRHAEAAAAANPRVVLAVTKRGGHLGWLAGWRGHSWMMDVIMEWLEASVAEAAATSAGGGGKGREVATAAATVVAVTAAAAAGPGGQADSVAAAAGAAALEVVGTAAADATAAAVTGSSPLGSVGIEIVDTTNAVASAAPEEARLEDGTRSAAAADAAAAQGAVGAGEVVIQMQ